MYTEKAFMSTSMDKRKIFKGNVAFEIKIKDGAIIEDISYFKTEKEVLLKAGQEFKVLSYEYDEEIDLHTIMLEQL